MTKYSIYGITIYSYSDGCVYGCDDHRWGKSELQRARCQSTAGEGDFKDSATEIDRLKFSKIYVKLSFK